ncbi:hypothetical protein SAMN05421754_100538 [Nitrosomonas sp. Nm58]|nr:hypothetical protein SAMN05421754_100538 [Nitrosomonas sp. Nm58]
MAVTLYARTSTDVGVRKLGILETWESSQECTDLYSF